MSVIEAHVQKKHLRFCDISGQFVLVHRGAQYSCLDIFIG